MFIKFQKSLSLAPFKFILYKLNQLIEVRKTFSQSVNQLKMKLSLLKKLTFYFFFFIFSHKAESQQIQLYEQFFGKYDYLAIGNTLNMSENGTGGPCTILTESSATLTLTPGQTVVAAYLYWAGSGAGVFNVKLNGIDITAERTFSTNLFYNGFNHLFFGAFCRRNGYCSNYGKRYLYFFGY